MKYLDGIVSHEAACSNCQHMRKLHNKLNHGSVEENKAVLFVFNDRQPCKSYILVSSIPEPAPECPESPIGIHLFESVRYRREGFRFFQVRKCTNCNEERIFSKDRELALA